MEIDLQKFKENPKTAYFAQELERLLQEEAEVKELAAGELGDLATDDLKRINDQKAAILSEIEKIFERDKVEEEFPNEIVLEIRAGVGGEEAALFAEELSNMYQAYAVSQGWSSRLLAEAKTDLGGYKEVSIEMRGQGVYERLRFETGVHRVQRIPATEKSGRIHTSTASVAILPIRKRHKIEINPADLRVDTYRASGAGGQHINKTDSAVRITHIPTGIVAECQDELRRLLTPLAGVDALVPQNLSPPPIYHAHSSIMSLAHRFATTVDQVPPPVRLTIPEEARVKAAALLGPKAGRLRVGLVWTGNDAFGDNAFRATSLDRFLPILDIPGIDLFSLQKGPAEAALDGLPIGASITALGPHLDDFADTAAVVAQLDLVVMTDSSVAHLAGSLGVPVWNLVQHVPYWVYGMTGDRTPWYPSMRLYRQGPEEDWGPVFDAMLRDLRALAETHAIA